MSTSLRRFDFKIYFDYLKVDQSWILFQQILKGQVSTPRDKKAMKNKLSKLSNLTPGDFSTVVRQNRLSKKSINADSLLSSLSREASFKQVSKSSGIGFTAEI